MNPLPLAIGGRLLFREIGHGSWILIVALIVLVIIVRNWPAISEWILQRWRSR